MEKTIDLNKKIKLLELIIKIDELAWNRKFDEFKQINYTCEDSVRILRDTIKMIGRIVNNLKT